MRFCQVRFTGSKEDLKYACIKIAGLIEKMPDDAGDLQDRYVVTITQRRNNSDKLSKVLRYEPHDNRRNSLQERQGRGDGSIPAEISSGKTRSTKRSETVPDEETDCPGQTGHREVSA